MDSIKRNVSENGTIKSLVVSVTYKVSLNDVQIPKEVLAVLKKMFKNMESLPEPEEMAFESERYKDASRWLSEHIREDSSFQRGYEVEWITE